MRRKCPPQHRSRSCPDTPVSLSDGTGANLLAACPKWSQIDESRTLCKRPASGGYGRSCLPECVPDNNHSTLDTGRRPARGSPISRFIKRFKVQLFDPGIAVHQLICRYEPNSVLAWAFSRTMGRTQGRARLTTHRGILWIPQLKHAPSAFGTIFHHFEHFIYITCVPANILQLSAYRWTD